MAIKKSIFFVGLVITLFLFTAVLLVGSIMSNDRKIAVDDQMRIITDLNELQTYNLMTDVYGEQIACIAFDKKLEEWDKTLWDLGNTLERYRIATEEFQYDPFYLQQKKQFNDNELLYLMFLTKIKKECDLNQHIISFFYVNSENCAKCDDQSFVLTDLKREKKDAVAIFSFDIDLNISNMNILREYYNLSEYPCVIIDEKKFCGIQSKAEILNVMCRNDPGICSE